MLDFSAWISMGLQNAEVLSFSPAELCTGRLLLKLVGQAFEVHMP